MIEKEGDICLTRRVDMTKASEVKAAVGDCVKELGRIDILVNNVGGSAPGDAVEMSEEVWDSQIDHNLKTAPSPQRGARLQNPSVGQIFEYRKLFLWVKSRPKQSLAATCQALPKSRTF
jgi:NAD(P)-dependent dehydrogenase (short-subunit alcohol dehydrogenase family)